MRIQTAQSTTLTSGFDPAINTIGVCTPKALPTTPRMLELTAEPLNYNKTTKFCNLQGPNPYSKRREQNYYWLMGCESRKASHRNKRFSQLTKCPEHPPPSCIKIARFPRSYTTDALSGSALGVAVTIVISAQMHRKLNLGQRSVDVIVSLN